MLLMNRDDLAGLQPGPFLHMLKSNENMLLIYRYHICVHTCTDICLRVCKYNQISLLSLSLQTPGTAPPNVEIEAKAYESKDRPTNKKSKGTSGNNNGRTGQTGKAASSSGNDGGETQSCNAKRPFVFILDCALLTVVVEINNV
ncbi:hypothetical protein HanHA300_Chr07g0240791 [Helianthus annuus]|nr:hypothetical protein HanHA300_Chr07g0240791 [Helianthus annuus]KAJ0562989.1 hypothetical protein HanHA89_Chr07g0258001 [Helianthus annuus]KAJ0728358.1 hypothetical protein HanLR1_Chr07g0240691 [Helianthus annuus]KAJ0731117.1 hypothetical protein HanOQP8_Chr07g0248281 [Helianthus annuus]